MVCMGPKVPNVGAKTSMQLYQAQLAATIADLLGQKYTARHPILKKIDFNALRPEREQCCNRWKREIKSKRSGVR